MQKNTVMCRCIALQGCYPPFDSLIIMGRIAKSNQENLCENLLHLMYTSYKGCRVEKKKTPEVFFWPMECQIVIPGG